MLSSLLAFGAASQRPKPAVRQVERPERSRRSRTADVRHHGTFPRAGQISDGAALDVLRDCRNRVQSMALIHQTPYGSKDFAKVDFNRFLNALIASLRESHGVGKAGIGIRRNAEPMLLPIDTAVPGGLTVNELITNAIKHAFKGRDSGEIEVALVRGPPGEATLSVSDDGIGLVDDFDIGTSTTLGLQLVFMLADQIGGGLMVDRRGPTRFAPRYPVKSDQAA